MNPEYLKTLQHLPLFAEFTDAELEGALDLIDTVQYGADECIVKQDETGDCMFVLVEGSARVVHRRDGREIELAILKVGDFFGELALVDSGPRSADVETITPCTLFRIEHGALRAIAGVYPNAAFKLLLAVGRTLVQRMRRGNQKYIDSFLTGATTRDQ
ncbi:MAG: cyclic nucleotide-binding domain-containing protein [Chthoniobacteraceae bacterium]|jgi:CRP-like cAMP-binding protein